MNLPWLESCKTEMARKLDAGRLGHAPLIHGPAGVGSWHWRDGWRPGFSVFHRQTAIPAGSAGPAN